MGKDLYEILGVGRNADSSDIRRAYKDLSLKYHPDRPGGDPEKFKEIGQAHEILSDEKRRRMYDMTGSTEEGGPSMDGPFGGGGMPFGMPDFLSQMFGGMGGPMGGGGPGRKRDGKGPSKQQDLPLKLADFYHGRQLSVKLGRNATCKTCRGAGGSSSETCSPCAGEGHVKHVVNMGPLQMVQQMPCPVCQGKGTKAVGKCSDCDGRGSVHEEKNLDIKIEPGMNSGNTIVFSGMCSDHPAFTEAGDVVVMLREAEEEGETANWMREGNRLKTSITVSLKEALLGTTRTLYGHPGYPNGIVIEIPPGSQNMWTGTFSGLGMPVRGTPRFGEAYVSILVVPTKEELDTLQGHMADLKNIFPNVPRAPESAGLPKVGRWGMT